MLRIIGVNGLASISHMENQFQWPRRVERGDGRAVRTATVASFDWLAEIGVFPMVQVLP